MDQTIRESTGKSISASLHPRLKVLRALLQSTLESLLLQLSTQSFVFKVKVKNCLLFSADQIAGKFNSVSLRRELKVLRALL